MTLLKVLQRAELSASQEMKFEHRPDAVFMGAINHHYDIDSPHYYQRYELYRIRCTNTVGARYGNCPEQYESGGAGLFSDMGMDSLHPNTPVAIATRALVLRTMYPERYAAYINAVRDSIL